MYFLNINILLIYANIFGTRILPIVITSVDRSDLNYADNF